MSNIFRADNVGSCDSEKMEFKKAVVEYMNKNKNMEYFEMKKFMEYQSSQPNKFTQVILNVINLIIHVDRLKWITG